MTGAVRWGRDFANTVRREHARLLTKGDNNQADDTELCMCFPACRNEIDES